MADDKKKPIKLNDEQLMLDASQVADIYHQLTLDLFDQVIDRIKERGSASLDDNPYIWQLEKMNEMGLLNEDNLQLISERSGIAEEQLRHVIQNEGYQIYKDTKQQLLEATGGGSFVSNSLIQNSLAAYVNQTMGDINNLINTTLPKSVIGAYQSIIEEATAKVVTGLATSDKAISDTVMKWAKKGFYGFTDSQGKKWKADTYARQVIKSTAWRVYREVRMAPAEELGIDTYYYSKKSTAREMCAPLQHQIVTTGVARTEKGERILALSDYGYGTAGGCLGINCTHEITPFVVGANYKPELGEDVKDLTPEQAIENANVQAKQRALERSIRQSKEFLHVAEKLGDQELIDKYKSKVRTQQGAMRDYLRQNPFLHRDYAREKYYADPYTEAKKATQLRKKMSEHHYIKDNEIADFKKVGGKITKAERKVLYADENPQGLGYIGTPHSFAINKYLRDKNAMPPEYDKIVNTLDDVIEKNKLLKNTKVNRFDDGIYLKSVVEQNQHLLKDYDSFMDMLNSGQAKYSNNGYTSTSYIPKYNFFKNRPVKTIINIPKDYQVYFTDNDDESEIILPRGTKYDIISVKENKGGVVLEMNVRKDE
ncbi:phage minor capsid protein [Streptococcus pseudoporcinus]|uniref:Phage minor capsid 2 family protein n=1 Tax=Streptococcus pseudoporcinus TaxID=361101 RepID=A0A4U9XK77_9STRE|nr:phage minor capsid protein [Streptococcus pseudoporcinus]QBX28185.1 minor capsid protein [Streptococcus phage Javan444]VTS13222.1 phage minor capsid 2 family protein [Streptococcus pseudoporcinus]VUC66432.1 phage minor capsid 2 family protein [Streptococcus pseudoporcinus]VUC97360.1 phage minor capsid 2 family protein [Streptococcus pseudoporcinus]VUC97749.1 phage minor capsid 2 family protein [Streptococcus pseudoporcinus]